MELRKCQGYYGKCYHSEDMMVPVEMFSTNRSSKDGLHQSCKRCNVEQHKLADPKSNAISKEAYIRSGGQNEYFAKSKAERMALRAEIKREGIEMGTKRCSGYKGVWACGDDYPDHMVPAGEFNKHSGMGEGLQDKCRRCEQLGKKSNNPKRPRHPDTSQLKMDWITARAKEYYGGMPADRKHDARWRECVARATEDAETSGIKWVLQTSNVVPLKSEPRVSKLDRMAQQIAGGEEVQQAHLETARSMLEKGKTAETAKKSTDPRGSVYVVSNPAFTGYVKIGYAFDPESRLGDYQTGDPHRAYVLEHSEFFLDKREAEAELLDRLAGQKGDAQGEWRKVSVAEAVQHLRWLKSDRDVNEVG